MIEINSRQMQHRLLMIVLSFLMIFTACKKGVQIEVDGKTFNENTLKKENPELYQNIRNSYEERLLEALKNMSESHLLSLLAKEQDLEDEDAYLDWLRKKISDPSDQECLKYYNDYKSQNPNQKLPPFSEVVGEIRNIIKNGQVQNLVATELREARKKYNYRVTSRSESEKQNKKIDIANAPSRGNSKAKVTIVEFSGFECPYCQRVQATLAKLRNEVYPDKVFWAYKDYPLRLDSLDAHIASRCVFKQDSELFWQFFDDIYKKTDPKRLQAEVIQKQVAGYSGIDQAEFAQCLNNPQIEAQILDSHKEGRDLGVEGIPAFFINGRLLSGAQPLEVFQEMIEEELNQ